MSILLPGTRWTRIEFIYRVLVSYTITHARTALSLQFWGSATVHRSSLVAQTSGGSLRGWFLFGAFLFLWAFPVITLCLKRREILFTATARTQSRIYQTMQKSQTNHLATNNSNFSIDWHIASIYFWAWKNLWDWTKLEEKRVQWTMLQTTYKLFANGKRFVKQNDNLLQLSLHSWRVSVH